MSVNQARTTDEPLLRIGSWLMILCRRRLHRLRDPVLHPRLPDQVLELGIGHNEVNVSAGQIKDFSPSLYQYMGHLQIAFSGFIAATGIAVVFLVAYGVRKGMMWVWVGAVVTPVFAILVALPSHYPNHFDTLGHLGLIYLATLIFTAGAVMTLIPLWKEKQANWSLRSRSTCGSAGAWSSSGRSPFEGHEQLGPKRASDLLWVLHVLTCGYSSRRAANRVVRGF